MKQINYQTPRYLVVMEQIKEKIKNGELEPGEKFPSEMAFAKELGVSRNTLREALRILEEENIIIRKHGIGTFVNKLPVFSGGIEELFSITDMIEREGKTSGTEIHFTGYVDPHSDDIEELQLKQNEQVYIVKRVRTADGIPIVYCIDKLPASKLEKGYKLNQESLLTSLEEEGITISHAKATIKTMGYHEEISTLLKSDKETPLLVLRQIHYDLHDNPVLYSINFFNANQVTFNILRKRKL